MIYIFWAEEKETFMIIIIILIIVIETKKQIEDLQEDKGWDIQTEQCMLSRSDLKIRNYSMSSRTIYPVTQLKTIKLWGKFK